MILALDLSLSSGWSRGCETDPAPVSGTWNLPDGTENLDRALCALRDAVAWEVKSYKVTDCYIERPMLQITRKKGAYPLLVLVSLAAVAREAASLNGARVYLPAASTWRVAFLGRGAGKLTTEEAKDAAMRQCTRLGWPYVDDNAAEAMGIFYYAMTLKFPQWRPGRKAA